MWWKTPSKRCRREQPKPTISRRWTSRLTLEILEDRRQMSFGPLSSYAVGIAPQDMATGDFNGDNVADLAVVNYSDSTISVLAGDGAGGFALTATLPTGSGPRSLAVGDFNGDGADDLATANNGDLSVILTDGSGGFHPAQSLALPGQFPPGYPDATPLAQSPTGVAVGDINGDGTLDLVATGITAFTQAFPGYYGGYYYYTVQNAYVNVLIGDSQGDGNFADATTSMLPGSYAYPPATGDLDGDGNDDVVTNDGFGTALLYGKDDGTVDAPVRINNAPALYNAIVVDIDEDGDRDLVGNSNAGISVVLGDGAGGFTAGQDIPLYATSLAVGDVNGDGTMDLAGTSAWWECTEYGTWYGYYGYYHYCIDGLYHGEINVVLGYGGGLFGPPETSSIGDGYPLSSVLEDFNDDGRADAAAAMSDFNTVNVVLSQDDWVLQPRVSINNASVTEGDSGAVIASFTVTVLGPVSEEFTVSYATASGGATAGADYVSKSGSVTFTPGGATTQVIEVEVLGDLIDEEEQYFHVNLSGAGVNFLDSQGTGAIADNDPPPTVVISNASVAEGQRGSKTMLFTVTLTGATEKDVWIDYATADGTATTANGDYASTSGSLHFAPGVTSRTIAVTVFGDKRKEGNETFALNLTGAIGADILDGMGIGTITEDDTHGNGKGKGPK